MVQFTTFAIALVAVAGSASAFKKPCVQGVVYCGGHLNDGNFGYTFDELLIAARRGGFPNPSINDVQHTLFTCINTTGGISTKYPDDFCGFDQNGGGKCVTWAPGNPDCDGQDCCKA